MLKGEQFCLRLEEFDKSTRIFWREMQNEKYFSDVTLACDDKQFDAHKSIISSCSPILRKILKENKNQHPLIYLPGLKHTDLANLINFMYQGEVNIDKEEFDSFLKVAEDLEITGLINMANTNINETIPIKEESYTLSQKMKQTEYKQIKKNSRNIQKTNLRLARRWYKAKELDEFNENVPKLTDVNIRQPIVNLKNIGFKNEKFVLKDTEINGDEEMIYMKEENIENDDIDSIYFSGNPIAESETVQKYPQQNPVHSPKGRSKIAKSSTQAKSPQETTKAIIDLMLIKKNGQWRCSICNKTWPLNVKKEAEYHIGIDHMKNGNLTK